MASEYAQAFFKPDEKEEPRNFGTGSEDFRERQVGINVDNRDRDAKFFFSTMVLQIYYVTSVVPPCDSYSAPAFRLIRYIHTLIGTITENYINPERTPGCITSRHVTHE